MKKNDEAKPQVGDFLCPKIISAIFFRNVDNIYDQILAKHRKVKRIKKVASYETSLMLVTER